MSVTLRKYRNPKTGTTRLRLDIYHNGQRYFETLKNLTLSNPTTPAARQFNKELLQQAEAIRVARAAELEANNYSLVSDAGRKTEVLIWFQSYVDKYNKKDNRNMQGALNRFEDYLISIGKRNLTFASLTVPIIEGFIDRLNDTCKGEGASSYYSRFKKAIRQAYKNRLMKDNIFDFVEKKPQGKAMEKDFLTMPEIQILVKTPTASNEVRRAAIFSLMTGLAWIDVKGLTWANIDLDNKRLKKVTRSKTAVEVTVSLNETAIAVLGESGKPDDNVFILGSANGANKTLKAWIKRAGINKEIKGWHNLRHSAGTNLAIAGEDVLTISRILAHTSTRHTARYVKTAMEMQERATNKLNVELT